MRHLRRLSIPLVALILVGGCSDSDDVVTVLGCPPQVVYAPAEVDEGPTIIPSSQVEPEYPDAARENRVEGRVVLVATVSDRGVVCDVTAIDVDPTGWEFENASADVVSQWRYEPALIDGRPVAALVTIQVDFTLQ